MTGTDAAVFAPLGDRAERLAVRDATVTAFTSSGDSRS